MNVGIRSLYHISIVTSSVNSIMIILEVWGVEYLGHRSGAACLVDSAGITICKYTIAIIGSTTSQGHFVHSVRTGRSCLPLHGDPLDR